MIQCDSIAINRIGISAGIRTMPRSFIQERAIRAPRKIDVALDRGSV